MPTEPARVLALEVGLFLDERDVARRDGLARAELHDPVQRRGVDRLVAPSALEVELREHRERLGADRLGLFLGQRRGRPPVVVAAGVAGALDEPEVAGQVRERGDEHREVRLAQRVQEGRAVGLAHVCPLSVLRTGALARSLLGGIPASPRSLTVGRRPRSARRGL